MAKYGKVGVDAPGIISALQTVTNKATSLSVCLEVIAEIDSLIQHVTAELAEDAEVFEPTEEILAVAAQKREAAIEEMREIVAAIVVTDRILAEFKGDA